MKKTLASSLITATVIGLLLAGTLPVSASRDNPPPSGSYVADEILAVIQPNTDGDDIKKAVQDLHGTIIEEFGRTTKFIRIKIDHKHFAESYSKIKKDGKFQSVQLNRVARLRTAGFPADPVPNDPDYPQQWQFKQLRVPPVWKSGDAGAVSIAVIDTGVKGDQKDLVGRVTRGTNIITGGSGNVDESANSHGTDVATFAAATADNDLLGAGPAYKATIVPIDVFNGGEGVSDANILKAIEYLQENNLWLANMSINADPPDSYSNREEHAALWVEFKEYYKKGGLLFVAAGNEQLRDDNPREPELVVVTSTNSNGQKADGYVYGPVLYFAAPGDHVGTSNIKNQFEFTNGSSFASPLACSVAALVKAANPKLTNVQILNIMTQTARKPPSYTEENYGFGIPDAKAAVDMARSTR